MSALPRCPFPGCPVRWHTGEDRPCNDHNPNADMDMSLSGFGIPMTDGMPAATPGSGWPE